MSGTNLQLNAVALNSALENIETIRTNSNCSCSECKLETCFTLRAQNSTTTCTCTNECKYPKTCIKFKKSLPDDIDKKSPTKMTDEILTRNKIDEIEKELFPVMTETERSEIDYHKHAQYSCKNISLTSDKIDWNKEDKLYEKSSTRQYIHSASMNYLPKEKSTAKLSAQIMNMSYQDFKDSLTFDNLQKNSSPLNGVSKSDVFKRLKEIYKACSCKVCECIASKFPAPDIDPCDCAPCNCELCTNHAKSDTNGNGERPHSGCPCVKCDRKDCQGVTKHTDVDCNCKPCDCVKCIESFHKSCNCEPCQCTECSALGIAIPQTIIVAPVHGNFQQNLCQCEPCDCANCTHNYNAMSSNMRREMSTGVVLGNCNCESCIDDSCQLSSDVCRCDMQNKVMKKPLEKTSTDYDIHRTLISYRDRTNNINRHDTVAMYALSDNYSDVISHRKSKYKNCYCIECECIICKSKPKYNEEYKTKGYEALNKYSKLFTDSLSTCTCSPCECQICSRSYSTQNTSKQIHSRTACVCNKCDCFICRGLKCYSKNDSGEDKNKTTKQLFPKLANYPSHEKFISLKKGKILTPSMFEANIRSASKSKNDSSHVLKREKKKSCLDVHLKNPFSSKVPCHQNITVCQTNSKHNNFERLHDKSIKFQNSDYPLEKLSLKEGRISAEVENMAEDKVYELKKSITLSKSCVGNISPNKLCEPFTLKKQNPIKDIDLLDKYIYLDHSSSSKSKIELDKSSINFVKVDLNKENVRTDLHDRIMIPNVFHKTSQESLNPTYSTSKIVSYENIHRVVKTANIIKEDINFLETLHKASSISIILCDRPSSIQFEYNDFQNNFRNTLENTFKSKREIITSNSMSVVKSSIDLKEQKDLANSKEDTGEIVLKDENRKIIAGNSDKEISKQNTQKSLKKSKGKNFHKIYRKLMKNTKLKKINHKIIKKPQENSLSNYIYEDMLSILENLIENINYGISNRTNSVSPLKPNISYNLHTSKNILIDVMDPEIQGIEKDKNIKPWPIMRKNYFLNSSIAENKCDSTIPTMEFNIKRALQTISMQTSENSNFAQERNGKQALTRLLFEVNNLLNSPMLQSSHSSTKLVDLKEKSNYPPKNIHFKSIRSDLKSETRQNTLVDKEVNCNLINSMEELQKNIKNLTEKIMMHAVYNSEIMTTKSYPASDFNNAMPKINSVKSSCEGLKAAFVELKTISDHSLMVKWRLPREVIYVQGYELQVDGRSVQKIFSPKRCMAVLTCLPRSEKLILTIRTLTIANLPSDHYPATTIVYRPRIK